MDRGSIGEYLMEEVISIQPPGAELLIRSSICDPISGPLADAICEGESSGARFSVIWRRRTGSSWPWTTTVSSSGTTRSCARSCSICSTASRQPSNAAAT